MLSVTFKASTRSLRFASTAGHSLRSAVGLRQFHGSLKSQEHYLNADEKTFEKVALNPANEKAVLVDFYAEWCNPCKMISPLLEKLTSDETVKTGSGRSLDLVTVDTDSEFDLATKYKVRALPTVIAFKDGQKVDQFVGALNEDGIRQFIAKL
ncbi:thioredoxin-like protein [Suillus discolor]|uniref:Thioredoxin-like protein n=1 Tax=Suillus discolor TaxID=1912936 RepID=A0A9P7FHS8_9AGAM|nr:thioredoxin-like protein [Suillus discolor]KAG2116610.1 thioredoxin-like protein [Suillus discolor]